MRRLLLLALLWPSLASAVPLQTIGTFCGTFPDQCRKGTESLLAIRGIGTDAYYVLEADPATGALPVNVTGGTITASFASVGVTGAAVPASADYTGLNNGGNLIGAVGDSSGRTVVVGPGTAGSAAGGVLTVQGVASMTPLLVNGSGSTQPVSGTVAVSNFPSTVDTNSGAAGASTLRVVQSTRSEAAATPLSVRQSNGTSFADYGAGAAASTTLRVVASTDSAPGAGRAYADSVRYAYSSGAVGTVSWVQLIASTAATINCIQLFDSSGQTLELGTGAPASETRVLIIPPGGLDACVPLRIAASTRVSVRALSATTGAVGEIDITGLN